MCLVFNAKLTLFVMYTVIYIVIKRLKKANFISNLNADDNKKGNPLHFVTHKNLSFNLGNEIRTVIVKCLTLLALWIWGTTNNFLYNMQVSKIFTI